MSQIRSAIYALLNADGDLAGLLGAAGGIYHQQAPTEAAHPVVVFHKQSGGRTWTFAGAPLKPELWLVKAVDRATSATKAEAVDERLEQLLNDAELAITGHQHLYLRRVSDVDYPEQDGAETYRHVGGLYRLVTQRA